MNIDTPIGKAKTITLMNDETLLNTGLPLRLEDFEKPQKLNLVLISTESEKKLPILRPMTTVHTYGPKTVSVTGQNGHSQLFID